MEDGLRRILSTLFVLLAFAGAATAASLPGQASKNCNIPASIDIDAAQKSPDSAFIGIFDGKWDNVIPATLIIYEVKGSKASGYYAWKAVKAWSIPLGCDKVVGSISGDTLSFKGKHPMNFAVSGRSLKGVYNYDQGNGKVMVEKSSFSRKR
jgi:hypothetical protein